jgi:SPP1 family phage portal protein
VASLINGQDNVKSNLANDIEQFTSALLKFLGWEPTADLLAAMKWSGGLTIPEGADIEWLVKEIHHAAHEFYLEENDRAIHKLSGIPDLGSKDFSGNTPIISIRMKLFALEALTIIAENKFTKALNQLMRMALRVLNLEGSQIDPLDIKWEFTRNLPVHLKEEAEIQAQLQGVVSDETRLNLASFVEDVREEIERLEAEAEADRNAYPVDEIDEVLADEEAS